MKKYIIRVIMIVLCISLFCTGCQRDISTSGKKGANQVITELNHTYESSILSVTATDIKAVQLSSESDTIIVGIRLIVENNSTKDLTIGRGNIDAYADDVSLQWASSYDFDTAGETLWSTIAPGKKAVGYQCFYASKNAKMIELHLQEDYLNNKYISFIFDIPPVEYDE